MYWCGVIKRMISLEFPGQKEVILFQCDWYDVPAATTNRGRGYSKDQFGVIDIDTTRYRYKNEPYILATQTEQAHISGVAEPCICLYMATANQPVLLIIFEVPGFI
jgi:hypothetical protein